MSFGENRLLNLLGISVPILCAPMAGPRAAGGSLASQVTLGGGFGFIAAGIYTLEQLAVELKLAREALGTDETSTLKVGVGFICWVLDKDEQNGEEAIKLVTDNRVTAIWLAFGNNLLKWIQFIRDRDSANNRKTIIFVQLGSVEDAKVAIHDWKIDAIVAQGNEAGGHGFGSAPALKSLLPSIVSVTPDDGPVVVGAGGLATGKQVAEILDLGAAGAVLGTRFCLTPESVYNNAQKQALVAASSADSIRSAAFDQAGGWSDWPRGVDGRALRNAIVDDYERGEDIDVLRSKYRDALERNDTSRMIVWAGSGVGLMKDIKPAKELVQELNQEYLSHQKK